MRFFVFCIFLLSLCSHSLAKLKVISSTVIIQDWVLNLGLEPSQVKVLIPAGADPHTFEISAKELAHIDQADLVFFHGLGFESQCLKFFKNTKKTPIFLSDSLPKEKLIYNDQVTCCLHSKEYDPHTWLDPQNVQWMIQSICDQLCTLDPSNTMNYKGKLDIYLQELQKLDSTINQISEKIPSSQKKIITQHNNLAYFAKRYNFSILTHLHNTNTTEHKDPSAKQFSKLIQVIQENQVSCITFDSNDNPKLPEALCAAAKVPPPLMLYTESFANKEENTYIKMMLYNINALYFALKRD